MLKLSFGFRHNVRDVGGNSHNFPFDTMTKVYRDAVYSKDPRYAGNPLSPLHEKHTNTAAVGGHSSPASASPFARVDGTNDADRPATSASPHSELARGPRRSGVQKEILNLYRDMLKALQRMQNLQTRKQLREFIREKFNSNRDIPRRHVTRIEWELHHGKNKLEELRAMRADTNFSIFR